jgi:hypothetical protein
MTQSGVMDLNLSQFVESKKSSFLPVAIPQNKVSSGVVNSRSPVTQATSGIFGISLGDVEKSSVKRTSSFVMSLKNIGNMVGLSSSSTTANYSPSANRSPPPKRRPQTLYSTASAIDSNPKQPQNIKRKESLTTLRPEPNSILVKSRFFEWSCDYFTEPQMKIPETDDPGSEKYCERQWRLLRNRRINELALESYKSAGICHHLHRVTAV